ncbi:regulator of volume decrease after cellular swelling-domain-containing protein [Nemania sp. FL0916]|nr:regulator of volume decrease after cellular swelling-domain-containing protein [Nemania sp. FL0916]
MLPGVIHNCPSAENDFLPLSEYQAQTPTSFFNGKPVLYFHDANIKAWASSAQCENLFFFSKAATGDNATSSDPTPPESLALEPGRQTREERRVEVFVSSKALTLFSHSSAAGIEIPYPAISLHAIKNFKRLDQPDDESHKFAGVYMQLEFSDSATRDDDEFTEPIELTLIPCKTPSDQSAIDPLNTERTGALFNQISACSNLHPDPHNGDEDEDDEGGLDTGGFIVGSGIGGGAVIEGLPGVFQGSSSGDLPPPMPGSSGWITADNVHEFFNEDGEWIGEDGVSGELGDGAGRVRGRDEVDQDGINGHEEADDADAKRPRTE